MTCSLTRWTAIAALSSLTLACSDPAPAPVDASTPDAGGGAEAGPVDGGTDAPASDTGVVDRPIADVPASDVGFDVQRDVQGDVGRDAGNPCASTVEGAACAPEGQACGGPCSDPCQFCNLIRCSGGRWRRLEVFPMPCVDAGRPDAGPSDAGPSLMPGSRMLWEAPGGFAGTGPAVMVDADGTVRVWDNTRGVELATPSAPSRALTVSAAAVADLFARWARVDRSRLPHSGTSGECSGRAAYRACAESGCRVESVMFSHAAQITPEMDPVRQWFDAALPGEMRAAYPRNYCSF